MRRHSPYNYAFNNPIRFIDPDGMMPIDPQFARGFAKGAWGAVKGTANFISETISTRGQNVVNAATAVKDLAVAGYNDPSGTANALIDAGKQGIANSIIENGSVQGAMGEFAGNVGAGAVLGIAGDKGLSKLKSLGRVSDAVTDVGKVTETIKDGGRLGNAATRSQIDDIASTLEGRGYTITGVGGRTAEEFLKPIGGGRKGGAYLDITAVHPDYPTLRINTVDVYKNGMPTLRELNNATRIRSQIGEGEHLLLIPKK